MDDFLGVPFPTIDRISGVVILAAMAVLVITDKLVWHTRLRSANARADRWEAIALKALTAGAAAGIQAAEVAVDVVASLPDPQGEREYRARPTEEERRR
jgi:hypothetical protein